MKLHNFIIAEALNEGRYADAASALAHACGLDLPQGTDVRVTHNAGVTSMIIHAGSIEAVWLPGREVQLFEKTASMYRVHIFMGP